MTAAASSISATGVHPLSRTQQRQITLFCLYLFVCFHKLNRNIYNKARSLFKAQYFSAPVDGAVVVLLRFNRRMFESLPSSTMLVIYALNSRNLYNLSDFFAPLK